MPEITMNYVHSTGETGQGHLDATTHCGYQSSANEEMQQEQRYRLLQVSGKVPNAFLRYLIDHEQKLGYNVCVLNECKEGNSK